MTEKKKPEILAKDIKLEHVINVNDAKDIKSEIKKTEDDVRSGAKKLSAIVFVLIIIILTIFAIQNMQKEKEVLEKDFDYIYNQTLNGYETENNYLYNNHAFIKTGMLWETLVAKKTVQVFDDNSTKEHTTEYQLSTYHAPKELEDINVTEMFRARKASLYVKRMFYLSYNASLDAQIAIAGVEVGKILGEKYGIYDVPVIASVYSDDYNGSYMHASCENNTYQEGVIEFRLGTENKIVRAENGCSILYAKNSSEMIRVADRFVFSFLKIMP